MNLYITSPTDTTQQLTMQQLLGNMRSGTGDQLLPADGSAITMEGRYFEGTTVVFNKDTAKLESVGGSTTNLGINAAFSQLGGNFSDITMTCPNAPTTITRVLPPSVPPVVTWMVREPDADVVWEI